MGTVKYTGPVASFHCPTNAEIRSLKVHFSPKQEGSGDPSPENVRPIVGWDGVSVYDYSNTNANTSFLPSEYQKVEYLESNGTQYIATSFAPPVDATSKTVFQHTKIASGDDMIWGYTKTGQASYLEFYASYIFYATIGVSRFQRVNLIAQGDKLKIMEAYMDSEALKVYIDDTTYNAAPTAYHDNYSDPLPIYLFAWNNKGTGPQYLHRGLRLFSLSFEQNNQLIANFIPCLRKSDGKPGIYDTVSNTFYTNAGTGEFLYGPEVKGYTTDYEFGVLGKNKLDVSGFIDGEYVKSDGSIAQNSEFRRTDYLHLTPSNYVYSATKTDGTTAYVRVCGYDKSKTFVAQLGEQLKGSGNYEMAFTVPENVYYIILQSYKANTNEQLELGSSATTYEPYNPNHTVYGGWVDLITGEVCEEWSKIVYDGTIQPSYFPWGSAQSGYVAALFKETDPVHYAGSEAAKRCICDKAVYSNINYLGNRTYPAVGYYFVTGTYSFGFNFPDVAGTTKESLSAYLAENPYTVIYYLNTPNTYHLAPTQLQTFLGQNNVWSNADYVEVEYDLHETQTLLQRKAFIMANQPHIESASGAIASFNTDLRAPLKECKVYFSPVQEGTGDPSPDNVRPITGWTGFDLTRSGKNLFGGEALKAALMATMPVSSADENTVVYGNSDAATHDGDVLYSQFKPNTQYTLIFTASKNTNNYIHIKVVYTDNSFYLLSGFSPVNTKVTKTFVTAANKSVKVICRAADEYSYVTMYYNECGIFEGVQDATAYAPYNGTTIPVTFPAVGKNLFDEVYPNIVFGTVKYKALYVGDGTFTASTNMPKGAYDNLFFLSGNVSTGASTPTNGIDSNTSRTITSENGYVTIGYRKDSDYDLDPTNYHVQVEKSSTATAYEPYGTVYGGYVDLASGELIQEYYKITLDGITTYCKVNSDYSNDTYIAGGVVYLTPRGTYDKQSGVSRLFCDKLPVITRSTTKPEVPFLFTVSAGDQYVQLVLARTADHPELDTTQKRIDFCNAWLTENPIDVVYPLKTPITYVLTPQQLSTLRSQNNVWSNANGNIKLKYWTH